MGGVGTEGKGGGLGVGSADATPRLQLQVHNESGRLANSIIAVINISFAYYSAPLKTCLSKLFVGRAVSSYGPGRGR